MEKREKEKLTGWSDREAEQILKKDGYNELPAQKKAGNIFIFFRIMSEPMLILLVVCALIYIFMGEKNDALMLAACVAVVIAITFYQEKKTENTLAALRDLSSPRALVIRGGERKRIAGREVVKGDLVVIREGDRVPADATVLSAENLAVDESLLTGESVPVRKAEWDGQLAVERPGGEDLPFVYSGTLVTGGRGLARVSATGINTEIGRIGQTLKEIKDEDTLLKRETARLVKIVAAIGLFFCLLVGVIYFETRGDLIGAVLAGLTLSIAILPEEFPVVLMIFMTLGAWRISQRKVLARRSAAIETLGAATVLCTDKTGTLTLNRMKLRVMYAGGDLFEVSRATAAKSPEKFRELVRLSVLASQKDPFDPIEKELNHVGQQFLEKGPGVYAGFTMIKEYPLSQKLLALSHVWKSADGKRIVIAAKGAPEAILDLCHMESKPREEIIRKIEELSEQGLRVLGVAKAGYAGAALPADQHSFAFEFAGLLGFVDPPRETAPGAVREAYTAGLRVIMITGDYPGTAQFIAKKIGLENPGRYMTGHDLERLSEADLRQRIKTVNIFARVMPEQKLKIVNALKANQEIVAMTGDGVNDAPALKAAHIGIAMGERGTDVAREASALVLLNDDFSSIVAAVRLGRRIYGNLQRAMGYIVAFHLPTAGMTLLPLLFGLPVVLFPAHIAFLEFIIDPACSTVFESEPGDRNIMKRPPRRLKEPILNFRTVMISLAQGLGILIATFALFAFAVKTGLSEPAARTVAFTSLVLSNLLLIIINLSWQKSALKILRQANKVMLAVLSGALLCLLTVIYWPFFSSLFHLAPLSFREFMLILLAAAASLGWFEIFKYSRLKGWLR